MRKDKKCFSLKHDLPELPAKWHESHPIQDPWSILWMAELRVGWNIFKKKTKKKRQFKYEKGHSKFWFTFWPRPCVPIYLQRNMWKDKKCLSLQAWSPWIVSIMTWDLPHSRSLIYNLDGEIKGRLKTIQICHLSDPWKHPIFISWKMKFEDSVYILSQTPWVCRGIEVAPRFLRPVG